MTTASRPGRNSRTAVGALLAAEGELESPLRNLPPSPTASGPGDGARGGTVITDFAQVVYENLKTAGVQNTKKGERLLLENLRPFVSRSGLIQFQGEYKEKGASKRAAVCIGPEYDTVGYELVRRAAREAADLFDTAGLLRRARGNPGVRRRAAAGRGRGTRG